MVIIKDIILLHIDFNVLKYVKHSVGCERLQKIISSSQTARDGCKH